MGECQLRISIQVSDGSGIGALHFYGNSNKRLTRVVDDNTGGLHCLLLYTCSLLCFVSIGFCLYGQHAAQ